MLLYPVITIVAYRCIEQIMHQFTHHKHVEDNETTLKETDNNETDNN